MLTLLYASDILGSDICWKKVLNAGELFRADRIIVGGRILGSEQQSSAGAGRSFRRWLDWAEWKLPEGRRLCLMGAKEPPFLEEMMRQRSRIEWVGQAAIDLDRHHQLVGMDFPSGEHAPDDSAGNGLSERIDPLIREFDQLHSTIFAIATPPAGNGRETGSLLVRQVIERYQPLLSLHGSLASGFNTFSQIGRTLCLFPGRTAPEGLVSGFLINLNAAEIIDFQPILG